MSLDFWSVIIGALIAGITSYAGIRYQVKRMIDLEVQRLKWNRYADRLLELGEHVSKTSVLIPKNIDKHLEDVTSSELYFNYNEKIWGGKYSMESV